MRGERIFSGKIVDELLNFYEEKESTVVELLKRGCDDDAYILIKLRYLETKDTEERNLCERAIENYTDNLKKEKSRTEYDRR